MEEADVLELFELDYSDLMLLSATGNTSSLSSSPPEELQRLQSLTEKIMENLGPSGPGLIAIKSVPEASDLRRRLLPLARNLALLDNDDGKRILKKHNLGSDVPLKNLERTVSSFAMQLKYEKLGFGSAEGHETLWTDDLDAEFKDLGRCFKTLGFLMMELGLYLARVCDRVIGGQELEQSLLESCSAKGRLIHYHSTIDNALIKEVAKRNGRDSGGFQTNGTTKMKKFESKELARFQTQLWQQWHYDYGIFTVLTAPMFILSCNQECPPPNSHTYLQIFHPERDSAFMVNASPESFIFQVGESADVLSKGKLRATLHCVCRPAALEDLSRETFVVFLQPAWSKTFSLSNYPVQPSTQHHLSAAIEQDHFGQQDFKKSFPGIHSVVPPLSLRMRDGMTFAEFSKETTKQYYGGSGLQSKR